MLCTYKKGKPTYRFTLYYTIFLLRVNAANRIAGKKERVLRRAAGKFYTNQRPFKGRLGPEKIDILLEIKNDRKIAEAYSRGTSLVEIYPEYRIKFQELYREIERRVDA